MIALSFGLSCNDSERIRTLYDGMMGYMMTSWSWTKNDISIIMQGASRLQSFAASVPWEVLLWGQRCRMTRWTATYPQFHGQRLIFVSFCQLPTYICDSFLLIFETWHSFLHQGNKIRPLIAICFSDVLGAINRECSTELFFLANVMIQGPEPSLSEAIGSLLVPITMQKYSQCTSNDQVFESFFPNPSHFGSSGFPMPTDTWLIGIVIFQPLNGVTLARSCETIFWGAAHT